MSPNLPIQAYWKRNLIKILDRAFRLRTLSFGGWGAAVALALVAKRPQSAVNAAAVLPAAWGRSRKPWRCPGPALPRHAGQ